MSAPTTPFEQKQQPVLPLAVEGAELHAPPSYEGGDEPPCKFRGGRRGMCHRRRKLSFLHRFALRFVAFFTLSVLYTNRASLSEGWSTLGNVISANRPEWITALIAGFQTLANVPFEVSTYFGLAFYSAFFALFITFARMRLMQKRKARFLEWKRSGKGPFDGHRHRHHHHHHRHARFGPRSVPSDTENQYSDDIKKSNEAEVLVNVQE